jgi:glycosyltransferase involved in cell wall biosynthesis
MKVLYLTHSFPREPGDAAGSFVLNLARALRGEQVDVHVVAPSGDHLAAGEQFDGIPVERFRYAPRRYENLAYTGNMATLVKQSWSAKLAMVGFLGSEFGSAVRARRNWEPDLIHAHWWFPGGLVGTWVSGLSHLPLVTTLHGSDVRLIKGSPFARPLFRRVLQQSAAVTAVSRWLATEAAAISGVEPMVAPMPVNTELFSPGGQRDAGRLLFVGRLSEQKGIELLVRAFAAMQGRAMLDIVGDGAARGTLEALARELGVAGRITWHGALAQPNLVELYRRATMLVVPSIGEGLGLVAVEALLCQTPVVAFDSGGLVDTVQHDRSGLLVPPGDVPALTAALDSLLADPERARRLGEAGRMVALASFAPESVARRYAAIYRDALGAATT